MSDWPQKFLHAYSERHHYDSISAADEQLSLDDAYDVQHQYVSLRKEVVTGYKAALTAPAAQQAMGIDVPIIGVLFDSGAFSTAKPITLSKQALLETELGFKAATDISQEVTPDTVFTHMAACLPMIEIASPNLATKPNGLDLIATNAASYGYIAGPEHDLEILDLDLVHVSLTSGGDTLLQGDGGEVLGGQRHALAWLINQVLQRGYQVEAGHLFMTGSIGGMQPAKAGAYQADFEALGRIDFSIA